MKPILAGLLALSITLGGVLAAGEPTGTKRTFNVLAYGAKPDGSTLCTESIQKAIDDCAKSGGGTVFFPEGKFLSGTIFLKSEVSLNLDKNATLLGSTNIQDFPNTPPANVRSFNDGRSQKQLIFGENLQNIAITGDGTIDGQGGSFPKSPRGTPDRPFVIRLVACKNILIESLNLRNSPFWMQHYLECDDLTVRGIHVFNHANANNDTIDIDGCHRVHMENCDTDSSDDGITLKCTSLRACEDVTVTKCVIRSHAVGIKFGTESIGGYKRIRISDCDVKLSQVTKGEFGGHPNGKGGIALMSLDGATMEDVQISSIRIEGTISPIYIRLHNRGREAEKGKKKPIGCIRNITLSNITATNAESTGSLISGIEGHPVENITLKNIHITAVGGVKEADVKYPEDEQAKGSGAGPGMFKIEPAYGILFYQVKGLVLENVITDTKKSDERPGMAFSEVEDAKLDGKVLNPESPVRPKDVVFIKQFIRPPASAAPAKKESSKL